MLKVYNPFYIVWFFLLFGIVGSHAQTFPYKNTFKTNDLSGITIAGVAYLTSAASFPPPPDRDNPGDGVLRLTSADGNQQGNVYINQAFPSSKGIKVEFEYFTYGGTQADGISFFLFDASKTFEAGQYGGALGYAQSDNVPEKKGMEGGFLAIGLDEYGNFGVATETKNGGFVQSNGFPYSAGTDNIRTNGLVVIRGGVGPGGERFGPLAYPFIGGKITKTKPDGITALDDKTPRVDQILPLADQFTIAVDTRVTDERLPDYRKVRLDITKSPGINSGFKITVEIFVGEQQRWIKVLDNVDYLIDDSKIPVNLKAGFASSTGFRNAVHEIRNVTITPAINMLLKPQAKNDTATGAINSTVKVNDIIGNDIVGVNNAASIGIVGAQTGSFVPGTIDLDPSTIKIESVFSVPGKGEFKVSDNGELTFTPEKDFVGKATVNYTFQDTYIMTSSIATVSVIYSPLVADIIKSAAPKNTIVKFSGADFSGKFTGPLLSKIQITSLPPASKGTLQLNNAGVISAISLNQEIQSADLNKIEFKPFSGYVGAADFGWNGSDGTSYATTSAKVDVSFTNARPLLASTTETVLQNITLSPFPNTTFIGQFTDADADLLVKIKITQLPAFGTLKGNTGAGMVNLQTGDEILKANLSSISYVPNLNNTTADSFKWNAYDGTEYALNDAIVSLVMGNSAPVIAAISKTGFEDKVLKFTAADFSSKFSDANNDPLVKILISSLPSDGLLRINNAGVFAPVSINQEIPAADLDKIEFVPNSNFNGIVSAFNWNGSDGTVYASAVATIKITINPVNEAPSFIKGSDQVLNNTGTAITVNGWATAISAGPVNESSQTLSFILNNSNNTLFSVQPAVSANGTLTFTPAANAAGRVTVSISIKDNGGVLNGGVDQSAVQTFEITIKPKGINDIETTTINTSVATAVTSNDGPSANGNGIVVTPSVSAKGGVTIVDAGGKVIYTPPVDYVGNDSYTYTLSKDGAVSDAITVSIKVKPKGTADSEVILLNTSVTTNVKANDGPGAPLASVVLASAAAHGTATLVDAAIGKITYVPNSNFQGSDSYTYILRTADGVDSDPILVTITTASPSISISKVITNVEPLIPGAVITYTIQVKNVGAFALTGLVLTDANAIIPTGQEFIGNLSAGSSKTIKVSHILTQADIDLGGVSNQASISGRDPSDNPVFKLSDDPGTVALNDATILSIPRNAGLTVTKQVISTGLYKLGSIITYNIVIKNTGNVTLTNVKLTDANAVIATGEEFLGILAPNALKTITVTHLVTQADVDAGRVTNQASVSGTDPSGTVLTKRSDNPATPAVNDPTEVMLAKAPTAVPDQVAFKQNKPVAINVLQNDLPGSTMLVPGSISIVTPPLKGVVVLNTDGTLTFTPEPGFKGADEFSYTVKDQNGLLSNPAKVTIEVQATTPEALNDEAETPYNTSVNIQVLANDKIDESAFNDSSLEIVDQPQNGTLTINADGSITYAPKKNYTGSDAFTYKVADINGNFTQNATVTITVTGFMIPNVFTPNGDGKNDAFVIVGIQSYDNVDLSIFNRWGNEVYRSADYKNNWNGEGLNAGTYYYLLQLSKGSDKETHKGWVLIKK